MKSTKQKLLGSGVFYFLAFTIMFLLSKSGYGKPEFPRASYQRLERSALSSGYGDVASSMALLFRYREMLDRCDNPNAEISSYHMAEFLDSFIVTVNQYMSRGDIWRPAVRQSAENYVANASVLIQLYLEKKIEKFAEEALDKEILEMCPKMHTRLANLLAVGATSESSLKNKWQATKSESSLKDPRWGKAVNAMQLLDSEKNPVCTVNLKNTSKVNHG